MIEVLIVICPSTIGTAAVTLTSTLDERQAACPGEVVTYTCTAPRTSSIGWNVPPDIMQFNYFPSSPIGQQDIGDYQVALVSNVPISMGLADLNITLTVTATADRNGTVVQCLGDEPSETINAALSIASEPIDYSEYGTSQVLYEAVKSMLLYVCVYIYTVMYMVTLCLIFPRSTTVTSSELRLPCPALWSSQCHCNCTVGVPSV